MLELYVIDCIFWTAKKILYKESYNWLWGNDPCSIPLGPAFVEGSIPPTAYNVVKDQEFRGEVKVGLTFTPERGSEREFEGEEGSYGGWKESAMD